MRIGYFSSSTPITAISPVRFSRAKRFLESKGIDLVAGNLTGQKDFYRAGSIKERAAEINQLIHNDTVDILMGTIGGMNTNSLLPYIDFDYLQQHPKTVIGYSDTTALLLAVSVKAPACRVLYGPALVATFGEFSPIVDEAFEDFMKIYTADESVTVNAPKYWTDESINWEDFSRDKKMIPNHWGYTDTPILEGNIIGGNLNTMTGIIGSQYYPKFTKKDLLFIEDAEKDASIIERSFAMLKNNNIFSQVKGIILGKHALFDDLGSGRKPVEILQEVLGDEKVPIIYDYDSSHTVPMMTTPLNTWAKIDANEMTATFTNF